MSDDDERKKRITEELRNVDRIIFKGGILSNVSFEALRGIVRVLKLMNGIE